MDETQKRLPKEPFAGLLVSVAVTTMHVTATALHDDDLVGAMTAVPAAMMMATALHHDGFSAGLRCSGWNGDADGGDCGECEKYFAHFSLLGCAQT